jgi:hypothetical protein
MAQQQADALALLAETALHHGLDPGAPGERYQVVVHVDEAALHQGMGRADLPVDTVRRLACDGSVITVVDAADGTPLDVGRKQRTVSTPLKRALYSRDRGCTFPGCQRKRYLDAHHLEHWANGGETSLDNLTLLCTHHHRLLHEGGFRVEREQGGALRFQRADGRTIPRFGYRVEDFMDDDGDNDTAASPSREGFCSTMVRNPSAEVRERRAVYRIAPQRAAR